MQLLNVDWASIGSARADACSVRSVQAQDTQRQFGLKSASILQRISGHASLAPVKHPGSYKSRTLSCLLICQRQVCSGSIADGCDECMMSPWRSKSCGAERLWQKQAHVGML